MNKKQIIKCVTIYYILYNNHIVLVIYTCYNIQLVLLIYNYLITVVVGYK